MLDPNDREAYIKIPLTTELYAHGGHDRALSAQVAYYRELLLEPSAQGNTWVNPTQTDDWANPMQLAAAAPTRAALRHAIAVVRSTRPAARLMSLDDDTTDGEERSYA